MVATGVFDFRDGGSGLPGSTRVLAKEPSLFFCQLSRTPRRGNEDKFTMDIGAELLSFVDLIASRFDSEENTCQ